MAFTVFTIRIETDNAAFEAGQGSAQQPSQSARNREVARLLNNLSVELAIRGEFVSPFTIRDVNGNRVGIAEFKDA